MIISDIVKPVGLLVTIYHIKFTEKHRLGVKKWARKVVRCSRQVRLPNLPGIVTVLGGSTALVRETVSFLCVYKADMAMSVATTGDVSKKG